MSSRTVAAIVWCLLVGSWVLWAPPADPELWTWVQRVATLQAPDEEPWVVAGFQLMGLWPLAMALLLVDHLRARPVPAWPFVVASFAVGAFALLPWFVFRGDAATPDPGRLEHTLRHPGWGLVLAVVAAAWIGWALVQGSLTELLARRAQSQFVWVMSWDFLALWATSVVVAVRQGPGGWAALAPLVGTGLNHWRRGRATA